MAIPDAPPEPTYYRILLSDPEGSDAVEIRRLLEDSGLRVLAVEELSEGGMELQTKKSSEKAGLVSRQDRKAG